jgi:hypothetical protein
MHYLHRTVRRLTIVSPLRIAGDPSGDQPEIACPDGLETTGRVRTIVADDPCQVTLSSSHCCI